MFIFKIFLLTSLVRNLFWEMLKHDKAGKKTDKTNRNN